MTWPAPRPGPIIRCSYLQTCLNPDHGRSWIIVSEGNDLIWPGPGLRPPAGKDIDSLAYGLSPPRLFRTVRARQAGVTRRT